jgi:imidazoleglycerol-phosphate dehydratase/histidinol-phosphatase
VSVKRYLFIAFPDAVAPNEVLAPRAIPALGRLREAGFRLIAICRNASATPGEEKLIALLDTQGAAFEALLRCPHEPNEKCHCAGPGLILPYLLNGDWDRSRSVFIGENEADRSLAAAVNLELRSASTIGWESLAKDLIHQPRRARLVRETKETRVEVEVSLPGEEPPRVQTGIGYFDHMLEQLGKHGGFDLRIEVRGDLKVDEHHTVEDTALALGEALRRALGDKTGIGRYGFVLPMDEAEARVSLDLSGRAYLVFQGNFPREKVGELPTELVSHFFRSLADGLGATLHIEVTGENAHHMVESIFKGVGRALRTALAIGDSKAVPSTKGVL